MCRDFVLLFVLIFPAVVFAGPEPGRIHPDESSVYTEEVRFSVENAGSSLKEIEKILSSFRELTDTLRSQKDYNIDSFDYTGWEMQNLAFPNMVVSIEGALLKQNYLIKKTRYDLICEKRKNSHVSEEESARALEEYRESKRMYKNFWRDAVVMD